MTDYSFMKSGILSEPELISIYDIAGLLVVFMEDGLRLAELYTKHANREEILLRDVVLGFKTRAYHEGVFWNFPDALERAKKAKKDLESINEEDLSEEISEKAEESSPTLTAMKSEEAIPGMELEQNESLDESWTPSECNCTVCNMMNEVENFWTSWEPQLRYQKVLKNTIELMEQRKLDPTILE